MADAFFVPFFSSLSFNTHGSKLIGLIVNCSYVEIHIIENLNISNLSIFFQLQGQVCLFMHHNVLNEPSA
ncbi:hypothetical protein F8388_019433 [Cannabis sativa]|uniref:Uncharacterized protein n=1 Tax=Cannabis sativa TaxID=3483 RepID=A0A7J6FFT5_CANSA|nr:hypothetical protein F8388_019433 [Cannabis sativa]